MYIYPHKPGPREWWTRQPYVVPWEVCVNEEIVLTRDLKGFRVVSGRIRLETELKATDEVFANVAGEVGKAKVFRTPQGYLVCKDSRNQPLLDVLACA